MFNLILKKLIKNLASAVEVVSFNTCVGPFFI